MDSKKKIRLSYRWRLFIPSVLLVWLVIAVLTKYQYSYERDYRTKIIRNELALIDQRILQNYERGYDVGDFVKFLGRYYDRSLFKELRVSVYQGDSLMGAIGEPLSHDIQHQKDYDPENKELRLVDVTGDSTATRDLFYTSICKTRDGNVIVYTAMPYTAAVSREIADFNHLWWIILIVTGLATLVVLLSTRFIAHNISNLQQFTDAASRGLPIKKPDHFPNDELGDISCKIFDIHNARLEAMERSEREHRIALHAIEEKALMKRQMTNNINHELKTPVGVIRGYLDTIAETPDMDSATRDHFIARARENVERLCSLLNEVSTITRLDEKSGDIPLSEVDMHDVVFGIDNDIKATHLAGDMRFIYNIPQNCVVAGNEALINGMIMNLVRNAAIHSHGTEITMRLISESPKFYVFAFADNGIGVAPEHIPHLFDRFYRIDAGRSRKAGGAGLGLPIVKSTVQSLGGSVSVHTRSTGGLEIVFTLRKAGQKASGLEKSAKPAPEQGKE